MSLEIIFLGINDAGEEIYEWLTECEDVEVRALLTTKDQLDLIKEIEPELVVSAGYGHIVPQEIIEIPEKGIINIHPALLPYNRGSNPNVWSIVDETPAGVTIHYMDENLDTGEIIAQRKVEKKFTDNGKDLYSRLEDVEVELFKEAWEDLVDDSVETRSQSQKEGTYHKIKDFKELCEINPEEEYKAIDLINRLRALTFPPFDNAYIEKDGEKYYLEINVTKEGEDKDECHISSY